MQLTDVAREEFLGSCYVAAERLREKIEGGETLLLVTHNDADALAACGIMAGSLSREGARFTARSIARIEEFFTQISEGLADFNTIVFMDIGSGYLTELAEKLGSKHVIILDHHKPQDTTLPKGWIHVNPHLYGIDGATHVSGAGVTYLVAKALNGGNVDYACIAVVGALGDLQDKDGKRSLKGINKLIVDDAVKSGYIHVSEDIILYGRNFKPLHQALASTTSPYIPGLSGNEDEAYAFLTQIGIKVKDHEQWRTLSDLDEEEKRVLYEGLMSYLVQKGMPSTMAKEFLGTVYELTREEPWTSLRDAREFASLLNACGKTGNAWLGISVAMGSRGDVLDEAQDLLDDYRAKIAKAIEYVTRQGGMEQANHITIVKGGDVVDEKLISSVASILSSSGLVSGDRPLVAVAHAGSVVKVSARATSEMVAAGLDLGSILSDVASKFGGRGGGHNVAAGADVPSSRLTLFLAELDSRVGKALGKR